MSFFSSSFRPEIFSRNDFAFHETYDMSQFVEKSELTMMTNWKISGNMTNGIRKHVPQQLQGLS